MSIHHRTTPSPDVFIDAFAFLGKRLIFNDHRQGDQAHENSDRASICKIPAFPHDGSIGYSLNMFPYAIYSELSSKFSPLVAL